MITIPVALLSGGAVWLLWKADMAMGAVIAALVCGYALATSPIAGAINGLGSGIATAVQEAGDNSQANSSR
ncbi:hypothetical protein PV518_51000 [Streptomyces sp. ND04-05B]|jgi:hypothetical protein|uniref:hypothetical protein n=1 Tax=Streptomyces sp. ND04-05B TaxID=3028693 RepID=UPI0029BA94B6|nr:hypothetical protein [Streptomyces sp. ND04-05B]MDX3070355.1 hypothetical protein [Streptomyces sp. ND04-05B]